MLPVLSSVFDQREVVSLLPSGRHVCADAMLPYTYTQYLYMLPYIFRPCIRPSGAGRDLHSLTILWCTRASGLLVATGKPG